MKLKDKISDIKSTLSSCVGEREAYWISRDIFEDVMRYTEVDILLKGDEELSDFVESKIDGIVARLLDGEPLQYVLGWARFAGNRFEVTRDTLIPRPETQELVDLIISQNSTSKDLKVIDIGTGSGCIAISLARGLKFSQVEALDISQGALEVAQRNSSRLKTKVKFTHGDALNMNVTQPNYYDIIVSNPPYIADKERDEMEPTVLDYEPSTALFVPDDDPIKFYTAIAKWGIGALKNKGKIYFEINPIYATEMIGMMRELNYEEVLVTKDMYGRDRFLSATKGE
ncbi:MAG: peptide chain release factor N(5)-glutamine methyltransferase [Muribaculaceae bacterium]|nr:peptide chain release factor N(5)-glutamine methyltransferase [Muribaculaceae bacterium]